MKIIQSLEGKIGRIFHQKIQHWVSGKGGVGKDFFRGRRSWRNLADSSSNPAFCLVRVFFMVRVLAKFGSASFTNLFRGE